LQLHSFSVLGSALLCGAFLTATGCAASDEPEVDAELAAANDDAHETAEADLTSAQKDAICNNVPRSRSFTAVESARLQKLLFEKLAARKRENDRLIATRGIGKYLGNRSQVYRLLNDTISSTTKKAFTASERATRKARAISMIDAHLSAGSEAAHVASELTGTSCIGFVYDIMRSAYADLGRKEEWAAVEKCGRAWDSDALHVQKALMETGWPSPALPFITDEANSVGAESEKGMLREFTKAIARANYYGTPISKSSVLKNFLPMPGSRTAATTRMLTDIGSGDSFGLMTFRGAYSCFPQPPCRTIWHP
jgi:hypothetical protein